MFQFEKTGQGPAVLLLHGFCLDTTIWSSISAALSKRNTLYNLALPQTDHSSLKGHKPDFSLLSQQLLRFIESEKIASVTILGHSMGGYLGLDFLKQYPEKINQLILLHSTAEIDDEERRIQRFKSLDFVEKHGPAALMQSFIPSLFHNDHTAVEEVISNAKNTLASTFKWYTHAMLDRKERLDLLEATDKRIVFIAGEHDKIMPVDSILSQARLNSLHEFYMLENAAHMGMLEQPEKLRAILHEIMDV